MANSKWHLAKRFQMSQGFTITELAISMGIFLILAGLVTLNLTSSQHKATITSTVETLLADLGQQQLKAMVGDTEGRATLDTYGIHFNSTSYTLFHGNYSANESTNFSINAPATQQFSTLFQDSQIVFQKGSGEVATFSAVANTITVSDTSSGEQKTIQINKYGVVTGVN